MTQYIHEYAILKSNFDTIHCENNQLRYQLENLRQSYEQKLKRRDDHRRKKKQEWNQTYNQLKEENEYLKNCSATTQRQDYVNADQILSNFMKRTNSQQRW